MLYIKYSRKKIFTYKNNTKISKDSFINCFKNIDKITIINQKNEKIINIIMHNIIIKIKINQNNQIIEYYNKSIEYIPDNFMMYNKTLKKIELPNTIKIGNMFLPTNNTLTNIIIPKVIELGDYFLYDNTVLEELNTPQLQILKEAALKNNYNLKKVIAPNLTIINDKTFIDNDYKTVQILRLMVKLRLISLKNIIKSKIKPKTYSKRRA